MIYLKLRYEMLINWQQFHINIENIVACQGNFIHTFVSVLIDNDLTQ